MTSKPLIFPFIEIVRVPKKSQKKDFDATEKRFRKQMNENKNCILSFEGGYDQ